jgi:hypothetical protein
MKYLIISILVLLVLFIISQFWANQQTKDIEMYPYEVLQKFDDFEIRKYAKANFAYVTIDAQSYKEGSGAGFGQLAEYIFGGNAEKKQIAMTSPVEMTMDEKMTMKFMVPSKYNIEDLPKPDNVNVKFEEEPEKIMAALRFGGFANDKKIAKYRKQLFDLVEQNGFSYIGQWSLLGYNPPFELLNRRNEVIVELENFKST